MAGRPRDATEAARGDKLIYERRTNERPGGRADRQVGWPAISFRVFHRVTFPIVRLFFSLFPALLVLASFSVPFFIYRIISTRIRHLDFDVRVWGLAMRAERNATLR